MWQPIETAPESGYIVGAWKDGTRWLVAVVFNEYDEWVNIHSDMIHRPTHWAPLPDAHGEELPGDGRNG